MGSISFPGVVGHYQGYVKDVMENPGRCRWTFGYFCPFVSYVVFSLVLAWYGCHLTLRLPYKGGISFRRGESRPRGDGTHALKRAIRQLDDGPVGMLWRWRSDACQNFYQQRPNINADEHSSAQGGTSIRDDATVWEQRSGLWLPGREVNGTAVSWPKGRNIARFQRVITYEDIHVPLHPKPHALDQWCMPYFIRAPLRAVKLDLAAVGTVKVMHPAVWKVASSTITELMSKPPFSHHRGPHDQALGNCLTGWTRNAAFHPGGCSKVTTANLCHLNPVGLGRVASMGSFLKFVFVRDPFERFAAGVHEKGDWNSTNMRVNVQAARELARSFKTFPHSYRTCPLPTQSYFLSATDVSGKPIDWDFIAKLEDFDQQWISLGTFIGTPLSKPLLKANPSGSAELTRSVVDVLRQDLEVVCRVCQVYLQDYVCLGYTVPEQCCARQCAEVSIEIPHELLMVAC